MPQQIELGLDTFGDIQAGPDGQVQTHAQVIRNVIEESVLADEVGVYCITGRILPFPPRGAARRDCLVHEAHSPRLVRYRAFVR